MKFSKSLILASCMLMLGVTGSAAQTAFPLMPSVTMDPNGTLHFRDRAIPMPTLMSDEAKAKYLELLNRSLAVQPANQEALRNLNQQAGAGMATAREAALAVFPSAVEETEIAGVRVSIYTPSNIPRRNRNRVILSPNSNAIGLIVASVAQMKVVQLNFTAPGANAQVVAVYRELLRSHRPAQIAWIGLSGGCQLVANTAVWLPQQDLPFPGALALMTCAGGGAPGDTRITLDGLDPQLSSYTMFGAARAANRAARPAPNPGDPPREILDVTSFPAGFPPSYLLAGTRDLSLSQTVVLHRRLRNAGVVADLNVWEGMWHGFNFEPDLPETREAAADLASFLDAHMAR